MSISLKDGEVLSFLTDVNEPGKFTGIPEFEKKHMREMVDALKPKDFEGFCKILGLLHGTGVWESNGADYFEKGDADIKSVIAFRDDIFDRFTSDGIDRGLAFNLAEDVRKGKAKNGRSKIWTENRDKLSECGIPEWYLESCEKVSYLFPRAHALSHMMLIWRLTWFKIHYQDLFDRISVCDTECDIEYVYGKDQV